MSSDESNNPQLGEEIEYMKIAGSIHMQNPYMYDHKLQVCAIIITHKPYEIRVVP
jgi:hypothetical protein